MSRPNVSYISRLAAMDALSERVGDGWGGDLWLDSEGCGDDVEEEDDDDADEDDDDENEDEDDECLVAG